MKVALVLVVVSSPFWYDRYFRTIPREPAEVVAAPNCTAPAVTGVVTGGSGAIETGLVRAGTVPDEFAPVDVVVCVLEPSMSPGVEALEVIEERRSGDLRPLLAAIAVPSRPESWFSFSSVDSMPVPLVWLVDTTGRAMLAELPRERENGLVAPPAFIAHWHSSARWRTDDRSPPLTTTSAADVGNPTSPHDVASSYEVTCFPGSVRLS